MKTIKLIAITFCFSCLLFSCKPTEANYRQAYLATKQKADNQSPVESTIYNHLRKQTIKSGIIVGNDTIPLMQVAVKCTPGISAPDSVGLYSVAVAQFKQIFNARSMMNRLRGMGYSSATVVENGEPLYYVLISTFDNADEAVASYNAVVKNSDIVCREPYPCIFKPSVFPLR